MGPASDPDSVVDPEGRVHGIDGLYVADASLMPAVTAVVASLFADDIALMVERTYYPNDPPGVALQQGLEDVQ